MKRLFVFVIALFCMFGFMHVEASNQVITDSKIENPGDVHEGGQRGTILPEVFQDGHVFTACMSCYGLTMRLVQGENVVFETTVSGENGGVIVVPDEITGTYELQIVDGIYIYYGYVLL